MASKNAGVKPHQFLSQGPFARESMSHVEGFKTHFFDSDIVFGTNHIDILPQEATTKSAAGDGEKVLGCDGLLLGAQGIKRHSGWKAT